MEKYKVFILDLENAEGFAAACTLASEEKGIPLEIRALDQSGFEGLPEGYHIYFIHLHDLVDISELERLKEKQPESFFVDIGLGGGYFKGTKRLTHRDHEIFTYETIEGIVKKALL